ncbi:MAG TPA: DHH family phosphoesterase [Candidatus Angelobacter sp.]|nr:DHH family phosphoesterase [Candidatus Angelobacter sp.]
MARQRAGIRLGWLAMTNCFSKPEVIITHESDLDGLVAGVLLQRLARKLFNADVRLEACHYNFWKQRDLREKSAWVTDFTFEPRMDRPGWVVIDHHATESAPKNALLIHDINKSAGLLCYELCKEQGLDTPALDRLVHLNNVSDLFLEDDPDFDLANDYANLVKIYQFWNLHTLFGGDIEKLLNHPLLEVMEVKRRVENPLGYEWSKANVTEISPTVGFVETVIGNNNLIVHQLLEQQATRFPVLVTLFRRANNLVIASFRSRNGEALKIAEKFQGGGHANASGAIMPKSVRTISDALGYLRQVLNPKKEAPLNSLENLFAEIDVARK